MLNSGKFKIWWRKYN